ncbi:MAG TPA: threonine synthase [Bacteroidales bacterium]|nr:threonine synthase [Bacteroidales bacterium]
MSDFIKFNSTNLNSEEVSFSEALLKGLAPDGGLFMPLEIPKLSIAEIESLRTKTYAEIAFVIISKFLRGQIDDKELKALIDDAYNFPVPLKKAYDRKYVMRLDQGPTASFKDFAARMMGRLMNYYLQKENSNLLILTATSGDTGSAIANAFYGLDNIKVVVLFPITEVTNRQRKQMTTLGKNIQIVSVEGKFDDCQALVKEAFNDRSLDYLNLSSANSINIGRLIPQIVYYFYAHSKLSKSADESITFCIPSGNFGNMMGGVLASFMGLPVEKYIIATNSNDEFPILLESEKYDKIEPSKNCISSAMNVGHPSNLARLIALFKGVMDEKGNIHKKPDFERLRNTITSYSITDVETKMTIAEAYKSYKLLLEPHGAVGWTALGKYLNNLTTDEHKDKLFVSLETAHPAKFPEEINQILNFDPELPDSLKGLEEIEENYLNMGKSYAEFKRFLVENYK